MGRPSATRSFARVATESNDERSSIRTCTDAPGVASRMRCAAASPFSRLRTGMSTSACARASRAAML